MKRIVLLATMLVALQVAAASAQPTQLVTRADGSPAILVGDDASARHGLWGITQKSFLERWGALKEANPQLGRRYVVHTGDVINVPASWGTVASAPTAATSDTLFLKVVGAPVPTKVVPTWVWVIGLILLAGLIGALLERGRAPLPAPPAPLPLTLNQNGWVVGGQPVQPPAPAVAPANAPQPAPPAGPARQVTVNGAGANVTVTFAANGAVTVHTQP